MNLIKVTLLSLLISASMLLLSGCTAKGPQFSEFKKPQDAHGIVYIYRENKVVGSAVELDILVKNATLNNVRVGNLANGGFEEIELPIGENRIWIKRPDFGIFSVPRSNVVVLDVKNAETYCLKGWNTMTGPGLKLIDIATCKSEILETKKVE